MSDFFKPYGVISTEYILPSAAVMSCGAKLHSFDETGEEPCIRGVIKVKGEPQIKTIFQFHEQTSLGEKVKGLLEAYKQIDFGYTCNLSENHRLRVARKVLVEGQRLRLWTQKLLHEPICAPLDGIHVRNTPLAASLSCLGHEIKGARRVSDSVVTFFFEGSPEIQKLAEAYEKPWGEYDFDEDHLLYHMKGAMENREQLIILLKRASVRTEVKHNGKKFYLPLNASKEKIAEMVTKLNQ